MRILLPAALTGLIASPALAADMTVKVEIPKLSVAEYHKPYVAIWIEGADKSVTNLAVWYDVKMKDNEGTKWLKDMRQWWRKSGRELAMPVDGLSGATQAPGEHTIDFSGAAGPLAALKPGDYTLYVEAAREVGGRELLKLPFTWPAKAASTESVTGSSELGAITLDLKP
ncbi:DUF2271 domain-containing protein [Iodidimonas sp. SYSU 1G8]|uniref:DUF2271 domain-containing protein n=1 Tax=Iodidimonas sp. SYSU 1G8 TaxID=3133967 RepID=UPI0031FF285D